MSDEIILLIFVYFIGLLVVDIFFFFYGFQKWRTDRYIYFSRVISV